jgi:hypothetical protein
MQKPLSMPWLRAILYFMIPWLAAIYPAVFHYTNNARLVLLSSFFELCLFLAGIGSIIYILLTLLNRGKFAQSAAGALLILVFFHIYGFAFDGLRSIDLFQIETYTFMPLWIFVAIYLAWMMMRLDLKISMGICNISILILGVLIIFNLAKIIPVEIEKSKETLDVAKAVSANNTSIAEQQYPDIYYLMFDEAAGFEVARQYWQYGEVDQFVNFLERNQFYVAEESHAGSIQTLREIATRLNYKEYPVGEGYFGTYNEGIVDNSVMKFLKAHGYTVIAYDERRLASPTVLPLPADFLFYESPGTELSSFLLLDEYKILVLQNTLLRSLLSQDTSSLPVRHRDMILYTSENISSTQLPSPKFVYAHLMLPHVPFLFSEDGTITTSNRTEYTNWQRYFENYKYFLRVAQEMVENILRATNGDAIIILQSDHGARNLRGKAYSGFLENYPNHYKTWIVNALYLPNCEDPPLSQDMDPINTFPLVFNCYFDAGLPIK